MLAAVFALSCLLLKNEGFFWLLSFLPGLVLVLLGMRRGVISLLALFVLLLLCLWLLPDDLAVAGHSLGSIDLRYRPGSWSPIFTSFFVHDNWHLLAYVFAALLLATAALPAPVRARLAPLAAAVISALCLFLALYLLTRHSQGAVAFTSINRVALQLIPAIGFLAAIIFLQLGSGRTQRAAGTAA